MSSTSQTDRRRRALMGLLVIALVVGSVLLLELALWLFGVKSSSEKTQNILLGVARPKALREVPDLGWALSPGFDGVIKGIRYRINALGFRGPEVQKTRHKGSFRVLCLGDSTTYGVMVDQGQIYSSVLEKQLEKILAPRTVETINAGVPGYSSVQVSLYFSKRCLQLDPDLVTLCVGINDAFAIPNLCDQDKDLYVPWRRSIRRAKETLGHSRIFTLLDAGLSWLVKAVAQSESESQPSQGMKRRADVPCYYENLLDIARKCERRGIPLLLFSFSLPADYSKSMLRAAHNSQANYIDMEPAFESAAKSISSSAGEAQSQTVSPESAFAMDGQPFADVYEGMFSVRMLATHSNRALFIDPCHPTPLGHKLIAEQLARVIVEKGLLKGAVKR
ncbi:MAG TPA: SGNH/GDSL hydrolase family protein [bacterium]|nr:SGNH/GDSL hydrolase family protein [bacterium]